MRRRAIPLLLGAAVVSALLTGCGPTSTAGEPSRPTSASTPKATARESADAGPAVPPALSAEALKALPAAQFDAVIPGLLAAPPRLDARAVFHVPFDTAVYGADFTTPVARIPAHDFLGEPTVLVVAGTRGKWSLVLTPARQKLPSTATADAPAPAQSAAWVPSSALQFAGRLTERIVISTSTQTLSILDETGAVASSFAVGVGTPETPTPTATGYLQARYLDPSQGQDEHRIQLTSLHATAADEPYGGSDGGLIGIHYQSTARGAVSHGCVRLSSDAIAAVDALPLGTTVEIGD
ncbi:L,D-transpeptidase [Leifsonia sp. C5G2]|uniref:L,D-transpeptidase family protein n=1 Tax=Leifsonia sp. C5G2 TaxID=2735269 RepID=UPI0015854079|nr:L,D-transpeptidase [Leifsonia sp. C5G2]NUU07139.1 L,D-transpeptidase [Leifsonia sp. C5G2]